MWYLKSQSDPRVIYVLPHRDIIMGRSADTQCCNFAVPDDPSLSRKHASLSISNNKLYLQDLGSKYGTFINNSSEKVESNTLLNINNEDIIKFGIRNCEWKVYFVNFTTCTSTLKGPNVQDLKKNLEKLEGILKSEWDDTCAYLTMPAITLTIKVVFALVQGSYIVTSEFWKQCTDAVAHFTLLPNPKDYIPQVMESTINIESSSFLPDPNREILFSGKTIVFFSRRQLEMYKNILVKSSAATHLLSESKMTMSMLCNDNVIVIQYNSFDKAMTQETQMQINKIVGYLKSKGKRVVADAEIGLAILYCSLSKYCNPDFNFSTEVFKGTDVNIEPSNILAHETEEPFNKKERELEINKSLNLNVDFHNDSLRKIVTSKRKLVEETETNINNSNKKKAVDCEISMKRPYNDTDGININPTKKKIMESFNENNDFFKFTDLTSTAGLKDVKKLNFTKLLKRKHDFVENDDENLFNFVEDNPKPTKILKETTCKYNAISLCKEKSSSMDTRNNSDYGNDKFNISTLRGIKLEELMQSNLKMEYRSSTNVKAEDVSEIDGKLNDIDFGSITVILKTDLIIKKDPIQISTKDGEVKNFKKFKKVWPVKMQVM